MLIVIISQIGGSRFPVEIELALCNLVKRTIRSQCQRVLKRCFDSGIDNAFDTVVVCLNGISRLVMAEFNSS